MAFERLRSCCSKLAKSLNKKPFWETIAIIALIGILRLGDEKSLELGLNRFTNYGFSYRIEKVISGYSLLYVSNFPYLDTPVVHFSDLHLTQGNYRKVLSKMGNTLDKINFSNGFVVISGDIFNSTESNDFESYGDSLLEFMKNFSNFRFVVILGNHDGYNASKYFEKKCNNIDNCFFQENSFKPFSTLETDTSIVYLYAIHNPGDAEKLLSVLNIIEKKSNKKEIRIIFCGHYHNGVLNIPSRKGVVNIINLISATDWEKLSPNLGNYLKYFLNPEHFENNFMGGGDPAWGIYDLGKDGNKSFIIISSSPVLPYVLVFPNYN